MKILLTGAFGNVGRSTLQELLRQGHAVRIFDRPTGPNRRAARRCGTDDIVWGDIRDAEAVRAAVADRDVVIHLVAIFPPHSEVAPERARAVNVGGTRNVLDAIAASPARPRLIYASSVALYGRAHDQPPPRTVDDPIDPTDNYTRHKAECEGLIRASGLDWAILRLCVIVPVVLAGKDPRLMFAEMFALPVAQRVECVHTADAGLALTNAATCDAALGRTLLIGGGPTCRNLGRDFIGRQLEVMGIGRFPDDTYATTPFHTDWVDTAESERLLRYQRHTFDDYLAELARSLKAARGLIRLGRPIIRRFLLAQSPRRRTAPRGEEARA